MRVAHWEWMVRHREDPFRVRDGLGIEQNFPTCCGADGCGESDPDWCFIRFGMSRTRMSDGRTICIGGEHEDFYDPDFCIYNDVIVLRPVRGEAGVSAESGEVEIYGYPATVFPPTDFHSVTPVAESLLVIGRLGYAGSRVPGTTPIATIDSRNYAIDTIAASGPCPGWIHGHHASFEPAGHAVVVRGGRRHDSDTTQSVANHAAHRLHLDGARWELIDPNEPHRKFIITPSVASSHIRAELVDKVFSPKSVPHTMLEVDDHVFDTHRMDVSGVRVTFEDRYNEIQMLVEGRLEEGLLRRLLAEIRENLNDSTGWDWQTRENEP
jgi:hypothetical protein